MWLMRQENSMNISQASVCCTAWNAHLTGRLLFSLLDDLLNDADEEAVHLVSPFVWDESGNGSHDVGKSNCGKKGEDIRHENDATINKLKCDKVIKHTEKQHERPEEREGEEQLSVADKRIVWVVLRVDLSAKRHAGDNIHGKTAKTPAAGKRTN